MNKLLQHRYVIRQNLSTLIGVCLCVYFIYHTIHGDRSFTRLISLQSQIETMSERNDVVATERAALEERVTMMRPGSIDRDLLEEQVRAVLGYQYEDEISIVRN